MSNLIYKKMSEIMNDIGAVEKYQTNKSQGFKFRGIDQFVNALHPALIKHGVFISPRCTQYQIELKEVIRGSGKAGIDKHVSVLMEYDFYAEDGSKVTVGPIPAEGLDSGDKATNKSLSAALKYCLIQTFSVPTQDMEDSDNDSPVIQKKFVELERLLDSPLVAKGKVNSTNNLSHSFYQTQEKEKKIAAYEPSTSKTVSDPQIKRLMAIVKQAKWPNDNVRNYIESRYKITTSRALNQVQYKELCEFIEKNPMFDTSFDVESFEELDVPMDLGGKMK